MTHAQHGAGRRPWTFYALAAFFTLFVLFLYGPMIVIYVLSFQGPNGGLDLSRCTASRCTGSTRWSSQERHRRHRRRLLSARLALARGVTVSPSCLRSPPGLGFRRRFPVPGVVFYMAIASLIMPGLFVGLGIGLISRCSAGDADWYSSGARRAADLDAAVRPADHVRGARPLQPRLRGGRDAISAPPAGSGCAM